MLQITINILLVIHIFVSVLMLLVVLMQRPKSEGLGAAFGGGMTEDIFGAQTTNVLTKFTVWLGGAFFALTLILAVLYVRQINTEGNSSVTSKILAKEAAVTQKQGVQETQPATTPVEGSSEKEVAPASDNTKPAETLSLDNIAPTQSVKDNAAQEIPEAPKAPETTQP